jgi:hypothetical protein
MSRNKFDERLGHDQFRPLGWIKRVEIGDLPAESVVFQAYEYWQKISPNGKLPGRQHVNPSEIPTLVLKWVFLLDVVKHSDSLDFVYRLVGSRHRSLVGVDITGCAASDVFTSSDHSHIPASFRETVVSRKPTFWIGSVPNSERQEISVNRGLFPLAADGENIDMLFGVVAPLQDVCPISIG